MLGKVVLANLVHLCRRLVASRDISAGEVVLSEPSELFLPYIQPTTGLGCCVECLVEVGCTEEEEKITRNQ